MRFASRLNRLEQAFAPERRVILSVLVDVESPPDWARVLVDEYMETHLWLGATVLEWHKQVDGDHYTVAIDGEYYAVTPAGLEPVSAPLQVTYHTYQMDTQTED